MWCLGGGYSRVWIAYCWRYSRRESSSPCWPFHLQRAEGQHTCKTSKGPRVLSINIVPINLMSYRTDGRKRQPRLDHVEHEDMCLRSPTLGHCASQ